MASIFENNYQSAQSWDMQGAVIWFTGCTNLNSSQKKETDVNTALVVQSLSITFGRSVSRIYPINVSQAIQILGIPEGTASMGLIWGPGTAFKNFVECFKDSCATGNNGKAISVKPFGKVCANGKFTDWNTQGTLMLKSPVLSTLGVAVQAAQGNAMPVNASVTLSFIDLDLS